MLLNDRMKDLLWRRTNGQHSPPIAPKGTPENIPDGKLMEKACARINMAVWSMCGGPISARTEGMIITYSSANRNALQRYGTSKKADLDLNCRSEEKDPR